MRSQRRFLSWSLALITAISLVFAGVRGAQAGLTALRALSFLDLPGFFTAMSDTIVLVGFALLAGTCAILIAPHRALVAYRIVAYKRQKGVWVRDIRPSRPFAHLEPLDGPVDARDSVDLPTPQRSLKTKASAARMKRPA